MAKCIYHLIFLICFNLGMSLGLSGCGASGTSASLEQKKASLSSTSSSVSEGTLLKFTVTPVVNTATSASGSGTATQSSTETVIQLSYKSSVPGQEAFDAVNAPKQVTIPSGQTNVDVSFLVPLDNVYQTKVRTLQVLAFGSAPLEFQITNADAFPQLSVVATPSFEGTTANLALTLDRAADADLDFTYAFVADTAIVSDYVGTSGTAQFTAGLKQASVSVLLNTNGICEATKGFFVNFMPPVMSSQGMVQARQNILEKTTMTYSLDSTSVAEGSSGNLTLTSNLTCPFARTLTFSTANGTAIAGTNYTALSNASVILPIGQSTVLVPFQTANDSIQSPTKTFQINLATASLGTVSGSGTVSVTDINTAPSLTWAVSNQSVTRANANAVISWQLSQASGYTITANIGLSGTAVQNTDYLVNSTTLTIPPGTSSGSFNVQMLFPATYDGNKTVVLTLSAPSNASLGGTTVHTLTMTDSVPTISLSGTTSITEGSSATYTATLSRPSTSTITVNYATANGTALAATDFTAISGTLTFTAGQSSKPLTVASINNSTICQANRLYSLAISAPTAATLLAGSTSVTTAIVDDDFPQLSVANINASEGSTAVLTASLPQACAYDVQFSWTTANGTAISGTDYIAASGNVTIPAGTVSVPLSVVVNDDNVDQGNRNLNVQFSNPTSLVLPGSVTTVTIVDNESAPILNFAQSSATALDSAGSVAVNMVLSHPTIQTLTDSITLSGTAVYGQDYTASTLSVSIAAGLVTQTIQIFPVRGSGGKTIILDLGVPSRGTTVLSTYTLTLTEDPFVGPLIVSSTDSSKLIYLSALNSGSSVPLSIGGPSSSSGVRISRAAASSPKVTDFSFSGDQQRAVFIGNNVRTGNDLDLYSVRSDGSSLTQLNPTGWVTGRKVQKFRAVGVGTKIIFLADRVSGGATADLYSVNTDSSSLVNIVPGLSGSQTIFDFDVSANGSKVVFLSDRQGVKELYSVAPDGSGLVKLNNTLSAGQTVDAFTITPDSTKVIFTIKASGGDSSLSVAPIGSGGVTLLSPTTSGRSVRIFRVSPDSSRVGYVYNATTAANFDLFTVNSNGSSRLQINQNLISGGAVKDFGFSPNSLKLYFLAESQVVGTSELYASNVDATALNKLSGTLPSGGRIDQAAFTPNSASVVYLGHQDSSAVQELYSVSPTGTGRVKLNLVPVSGGQITKFLVTADSSKVVYLGDQDTAGIAEVFAVGLNGTQRGRISSNLLTAVKKADAIFIAPNGSRALYRANQDDSTRYDWYSVGLDGSGLVKAFAP